MNIKSKKGMALLGVMLFTIVIITSSIGLYNTVFHLGRETNVNDEEYIRGYYAAMAGVRYAMILLKEPGNIEYEADGVTVDNSRYLQFFTDIEVSPANLTITITQIPSGPDAGKFDVRATYR